MPQIYLSGSVLSSSALISYSDVEGGWPGTGNISADPCFVDFDNGDYSLSDSSACINAGAPYYYLAGQYFSDLNGDCRIAGGVVDMGSYEFGSSPDSDADLLSDEDEVLHGSAHNIPDTDGDGLLDGIEVLRGTNPTAADYAPGISVPEQYSSILEALFLAFPLETITVSPGRYTENLYFRGKSVTLECIDPLNREVVENTILDGNGVDAVITFNGKESPTCIIRGFTITNGSFSGINGEGCEAVIENNRIVGNSIPSLPGNTGGGGIHNCDGLIQNNIISDNYAEEAGGGIARCDGIIRKNIISNNSSGYKGGGVSRCSGLITENIISNNYGGYGAGGIYCDSDYPTITNCLIAGNTTCGGNYGDGGGIYFYGGNPVISNCTIIGNKARGNYGRGGGIYCYSGSPTISNCILWDNTGLQGSQLALRRGDILISYSDVEGGSGGVYVDDGTLDWLEGNIDGDPCFVEVGYWDGDLWVDGDYRLLADSPCIDAGDPYYAAGADEADLDGNPRIFNGIVDMGAYEFLPGPVEVLDILVEEVIGLGLQQGIENGLLAKLYSAMQALEDDNDNNDAAAINSLEAFINTVEAQRGKKISESEADILVGAAQEIIDLLGDG